MEEQGWTCKKCTLVNSAQSLSCEACYGSKLKSLSLGTDLTLRKGEFWSCNKCTLKNPLHISICKVCKTERHSLDVPTPSRSPSPRHSASSSKRHVNSKVTYAKVNYLQKSSHNKSNKARINLKTDVDHRKLTLIIQYKNGLFYLFFFRFKY